jgi:hypothetical protein
VFGGHKTERFDPHLAEQIWCAQLENLFAAKTIA